MRRIAYLLLVLSFVVTTALAGCSGGGGSSQPATGASDGSSSGGGSAGGSSGGSEQVEAGEPTTLTLWTFNDLHADFYKKTVEHWNEDHPEQPIELVIDTYPNAEMHTKLQIALQSGVGAPDISDININFFHNFLKGDIQLVELNDIIDPERSQFVQSRFDIYSKDGKNYGIGFHVGATVVYYNKEIMDQAGVDIEAIRTWDDYVEAGKKVLAATGKPMTAFEITNQRPFWPMIVQRGSDYLGEEGVTLDNDTNIEVLQAMHKMIYEDEIAIPMPGGNTGSEEFFAFMNDGGIASLIMPMWYMGRFTSYMPDLEGKIFIRPMPIWEEGDVRSAGMGGTGTSITKQSEQIDLAKQFLAYAKLTKEANIRIWQDLQFDPIRWDVWDAPELQEPLEYFGNEVVFNTLLELKDEIASPYYNELSSAAQDLVMNDVMFKALSEQMATPEEALREAADELRSQQD